MRRGGEERSGEGEGERDLREAACTRNPTFSKAREELLEVI